jgi:Domain of unknown function (DUF5615)
VTVLFLADEDLHAGVVAGLRYREPAIDILDVKTVGLRGKTDPELLELAALQGRCLITHDRSTITRYFVERLSESKLTPGIFIVPQRRAMGDIIESLLLVWTASAPEEWLNQIIYLPFR